MNRFVTLMGFLRRQSKERPLLFSFAAISFFFLVVVTIFTPAYDTPDDPMMTLIVQGGGAFGPPNEHIIFSHILVGRVLRKLYTLVPGMPWYGVYMLGIHYLANVTMLYTVLRWRRGQHVAWVYAAYLMTAGLYFLTYLQFTTTAFVALQSGLLLYWVSIDRKAEDRAARIAWPLAAAGFMIFLGTLVRIESFYLAWALAAPTAGILALRKPFWRMLPYSAGFPLVCLVGAIGLSKYDLAYYNRDPGWAAYQQYHHLRLKFNDYCWVHHSPETEHVFDEVGWTKNDLVMMICWVYPDKELYSAENLEKILDSYPWERVRYGWSYLLPAIEQTFWTSTMLWPVYLALPFAIYTMRGRRQCLAWWTCFAISLTVYVYITVFVKPVPERVSYPVLAFPLAAALVLGRRVGPHPYGAALVADEAEAADRRAFVRFAFALGKGARQYEFSVGTSIMGGLVGLLAATAAYYDMHTHARRAADMRQENRELRTSIANLKPPGNRLYIALSTSFPYTAMLPLDSPWLMRGFNIFPQGWFNHSPLDYQTRKRFKISDTMKGLYQLRQTSLISNEYLNQLYETYVKEHYGLDMGSITHFRTKSFAVFKPMTEDQLRSAKRLMESKRLAEKERHNKRKAERAKADSEPSNPDEADHKRTASRDKPEDVAKQ